MVGAQMIMGDVVAAASVVVMPTIIQNLQLVIGNSEQQITELNYQYGHEKELENTLNAWASDSVLMYKKMPLIWVREDLSYGWRGELRTVTFPSIIIAYGTKAEYKSAERELQTFNTVLRPIYFELLRQIARSLGFRIQDPRIDMPHDAIERKYWGTSQDTDAQKVFSCPIDAIEITGLTLALEEECETNID